MAVSLRTVLTVAAMATLVSVRAQLTPLNLAGSMNMPPPMNMPQSMNSNPSMPMPMNMPLPETNLKPFRLPEPPKLEGALAPNSALSKAQKLYLPGLKGPESLVLVNSYIYTGVSASQVIELIPTPRGAYMKYRDWQLSPNRMCYTTATVSKTRDEMGCGRPLGLRMHKKSLIGMDASKGIFQISFSRAFPNGTVRWLMPSTVNVNGRNVQFRFLNDLAVSKDDLIYFTTSSDKHSRASFMKIILEGDDSGKVWMFNMRTRQVQPVLHTLHFPNGIQLAEDDSFLLVAEGARAKIHRVWLKGPRRGQKETFADNLPGFVDNLRTSPRGTYWVALSSVRSRDAPGVLDRYGPLPKIRQQILMMPEEDVLARAPKYGMVVELNAQGQVIRSLHDPTGKVYGPVSEVQEYNGVLFLGSYTANFIGVLTKLPPIVQPPPPPAPTRPASNKNGIDNSSGYNSNNNNNNNPVSRTNNNGNNMTINNNSNGSTGSNNNNNDNGNNKTSYNSNNNNNNNNDNTNFANKNSKSQNHHYYNRKLNNASSSISSSTSSIRSSSGSSSSSSSSNTNSRTALENRLSEQIERHTKNLTETHLHGLVLKVLHRLLDTAITTRRMLQRAQRLQTHLQTLKQVLPFAALTFKGGLAVTSTLSSERAGGSAAGGAGIREWVAPGYVQPSFPAAADAALATKAPERGGAEQGRLSQLVKYIQPAQ